MRSRTAESYNQFKREITEWRKRYPTLGEDNIFVLWFLRAYLTENESVAANAVCGGVSDKGIDAVLVDNNARTVFIAQGKYRHKLGQLVEKRSDVLAFADVANRVCESDESSFVQFLRGLNESVAQRIREARDKIINSDFKLAILYVTLGKCSQNLIDDARRTVEKIKYDARMEILDARRVLQLYKDYLDGIAPPVPTVDLEMENATDVKVTGILQRFHHREGIESWVFTMRGDAIAKLFLTSGIRLFARNIRGFMGHNTPVNDGIASTLREEPHRFFYYNNGITIVCDRAEKRSHQGRDILQVGNAQIINGQQTTRTLATNMAQAEKATVLLKVIQVPRTDGDTDFEKLISSVVQGTNWQNAIKVSDLMANDRTQIGIERELRKHGYAYARKRQTKAETSLITGGQHFKIITKEELAQAVAACELDGVTARTQKEKLFDEDTYQRVFPNEQAMFYLTRYWLMVRVKSLAYGDTIRGESRWTVLALVWSKIRLILNKSANQQAFETMMKRGDKNLSDPLDKLIKDVFKEAAIFFRAGARLDGKKIDAAKFFKSKRSDGACFQRHWQFAVTKSRRKRVDVLVDKVRQQLEQFDG
jgi:hypothetical protein